MFFVLFSGPLFTFFDPYLIPFTALLYISSSGDTLACGC
jgi:hypothetical protein